MEVLSPGKINLFLQVTGKRPDGYHELVSLMAPIGITDKICMDIRNAAADTDEEQAIRIACSYPGVPCDETNLAYKAASVFSREYKERTGKAPFGELDIHIEKQIPTGAGLGGGSSNAASVLLALNEFVPFPFPLESLAGMGMTLGADVPFFVYGNPALIQGAGEKIRQIEFHLWDWSVLVCYPGLSASTASVFQKYDFYLTQGEKCYTITDPIYWVNPVMESLDVSGDSFGENDLAEAAFSLYPEIQAMETRLGQVLNKKMYMSGSGSCLFTLYPSYEQARKGYEIGRREYAGEQAEFFLTSFYRRLY